MPISRAVPSLLRMNFSRKGRWMGVDRHGLADFQGLGHSARVVVVSVTENQGVDFRQWNPQLVGVAHQHAALSGIDQDAPATMFDPIGKAVFGQQPRPTGRVFNQDCNASRCHH